MSRLRHELYIDTEDGERNRRIFEAPTSHRLLLEERYGRPLEFEALPDRRACRIADYRDDADVTQTERHDEYIDWFFDAGTRLRAALAALPAGWESAGDPKETSL